MFYILQENKFILSERHDLCSFDEKKDMDAPPKRYAHMNFCVNRYSKAKRLQKLVFAEFAKADVDGPWTLLSCKTLSKKNHGIFFFLDLLSVILYKFLLLVYVNLRMVGDLPHISTVPTRSNVATKPQLNPFVTPIA
jgi:hypothetical protein